MHGSTGNDTPQTPGIARFLDIVNSGSCRMCFEFPETAARLSPTIDCLRMGDVNVLRYEGSGLQQCWRLREHIALDEGEFFIVTMPIDSRYGLRYGGIEKEAPPNSFVMLSTASPFQARINESACRSTFAAVYVRVPASLVRARVPRIDDLCGHFVDVAPGITRAMKISFDTALAEGPYMDDDSTGLFGMSMVDVICAAAARTLGSDLSLFRPMSVKDQILLKARQFIEANLSNPDLGCVDVARHCGISTRYLHTLSTSMPNGVSCTGYIKALRLARCREALQNRELLHRRAADIAADWGFFDAPCFTRLYKATFGKTPGQDRPPCEHQPHQF